eukprot:SAG25_NODE_1597_length_2700_cov_46.128028_3_plen_216_part_01
MYPTAEMLTMEEDTDITFQPVLEAGDAVVFVSGPACLHFCAAGCCWMRRRCMHACVTLSLPAIKRSTYYRLSLQNENTTHGTLPWCGAAERRCVLYRYTPKNMTYVPSGYTSSLPSWCSELTEAQRAVLEPPFVYHRPLVRDGASGVQTPRREGEETAVRSARSGTYGAVLDDRSDRQEAAAAAAATAGATTTSTTAGATTTSTARKQAAAKPRG